MRLMRQLFVWSFVCSHVHYASAWSVAFHIGNSRRARCMPPSESLCGGIMPEIDTEERETPTWCPEQQIYIGGVVPDNAEVEALLSENDGQLRIFGYGSLCWNPGAGAVLSDPRVTRTLGRARGYKRCWAQRSADHRGVPDFPGIVCTLLSDNEVHDIRHEQAVNEPPTMTEGLIYTVPPALAGDCLAELDFREKGGYARDVIDVVEDDTGNTVKALLYRGTPESPAFWTRALLDLPFAAAIISVSVGPSGKNDEYLYKLDRFLSDAASSSPAAAASMLDHTGDTDTGSLANMARSLQQKQLYFLFGSGSNQRNQLLLDSETNSASLVNGDETHSLKEIVLCTPQFVKEESPAGQDRPKQLYAGGGHSALMTESGRLFLWGWNEHGQLGPQNEKDASSPIPVVSELPGVTVSVAALGHSHSLVIERDTGFLLGFGDNERGEVLGSLEHAATNKPSVPLSLEGQRFIHAAAGLFHSAAISAEGELVTFGCGRYGQSLPPSDGNEAGSASVGRWKPEDGSKLVRVACGRRHTVILDEHGRVWTMGGNKYGQLGRSLHKWDMAPRLVDGILGSKDSGCCDIDCGWSHSVATLKTKAGLTTVYGWGRNDKGQLGTGSRTSLFAPTRLFAGNRSNVRSVACGSESTFVLDGEGIIYACGWNEHGNLSLDSTEDALELTRIVGAQVTIAPPQDGSGEKLFAAGGAHFLTMAL